MPSSPLVSNSTSSDEHSHGFQDDSSSIRKRPQESLEVETLVGNSALSNDGLQVQQGKPAAKRSPTTPRQATIRYMFMSTLCLVLGLTCPQTVLYQQGSSSSSSLSSSQVVMDHDDDHLSEFQWSLAIGCLFLYLICISSFWMVCGSDPGYLSARVLQEDVFEDQQTLLNDDDDDHHNACTNNSAEQEDVQHLPASNSGLVMDPENDEGKLHPSAAQSSNSTDISNNPFHQSTTRRQFCETCQIAPPLRSHHCKICDKCVATFDHHCQFVGTCIGERNHCRFWWFLVVHVTNLAIAGHYLNTSPLGLSTLLFPTNNEDDDDAYAALFVLFCRCYFYTLRGVAGIMMIIHTWMAVTNTTTFECAKGARHVDYLRGTKMADLPFSKGLIHNLRVFCCHKDDLVKTQPWKKACATPSTGRHQWIPTLWHPPGTIVRDSADWWQHPWENKYWSCCG
ncbi:zinc finger [Seminavis robusta]|uniref:Palmitoyltransferase n=1 Tax=Seminavis robusta TaxID=568900 RepID=A0A9N8HKW2_9STRA|nr:zinc finger [Seminavis robusta]|eukprot:Sro868_g213390.1 zinc finger (452) ;mRNA; f:40385-41880